MTLEQMQTNITNTHEINQCIMDITSCKTTRMKLMSITANYEHGTVGRAIHNVNEIFMSFPIIFGEKAAEEIIKLIEENKELLNFKEEETHKKFQLKE